MATATPFSFQTIGNALAADSVATATTTVASMPSTIVSSSSITPTVSTSTTVSTVTSSLISSAPDQTELVPVVGHPRPWPILKDMWSFFAGNAGKIHQLTVWDGKTDLIPDLKIAEKVGAKLTVCSLTAAGVTYANNVKLVLKDRAKSSLIAEVSSFSDVAKCWVLANKVTVVEGLPSVYGGNLVDGSGNKIPLLPFSQLTEGDNYVDIVKIDVAGYERFVIHSVMESGMRPSLMLVRWSASPDTDPLTKAAAASFQNIGYELVAVKDDRYLYHYLGEGLHELPGLSWTVPSRKNPLLNKIVTDVTKKVKSSVATTTTTATATAPKPRRVYIESDDGSISAIGDIAGLQQGVLPASCALALLASAKISSSF